MLKKLDEIVIEEELLDSVKAYNVPGGWDEKDIAVSNFKTIMKQRLYINQKGKCAYCGLPLDTRNPEMDHIAPKGGSKRPKHTECIFEPLNLVYACHNCNSPECKGQNDVVLSKHTSGYRYWSFKIVHPYLDDPRDFFECSDEGTIILLPKKGTDKQHREKADFTLELFNLRTESKLLEIAKQIAFEQNPINVQELVLQISTYRP